MAKLNQKEKTELPTLYDYFYYDLSIIKILDLDKIFAFAESELGLKREEIVRGASYLYELILISIMRHLEGLVPNHNVHDVIQWSHSDMRDKAIKDLADAEPLVKKVLEFNSLRKELTSLRTKKKAVSQEDCDELSTLLAKYKKQIQEVNLFVVNMLKVKRIDRKIDENLLILNQFLLQYNYIRGDYGDIFDLREENIVSSYPGDGPFFYMMPKEMRKNYHLQHSIIKGKNVEYLNGYKAMLLHFYKQTLSSKQYDITLPLIRNATKWHDLHKAYGKISRMIEKPQTLFSPLFKIDDNLIMKEIVSGTKVKNEADLNLIFRRINNLRVKVVRADEDAGDISALSLFCHVLFGAKHIQEENIEVLEFKQFYPERNDVEISYAIFIPLTGLFSDGSYWLFFDKVSLASIKGSYQSSGKIQVDAYLNFLSNHDSYKCKTYEIEGDLLKKYIRNRDVHERMVAEMANRLNISKGLLGEFLAYLYLAKKYDVRLIDISKDVRSTDIDVIAENDEYVFVVQAKSSLPITRKPLADLRAHFQAIESTIETQKSIQRILFLIDSDYQSDDSFEYMDENNLDGVSGQDMEEIASSTKDSLHKEGILVCSYQDLKRILSTKDYKGLLSKIDKAIDYFDYDEII